MREQVNYRALLCKSLAIPESATETQIERMVNLQSAIWILRNEIRKRAKTKVNPNAKELYAAKRMLKEKGWSYRDAAPALGVHFNHLSHVLNGSRVSAGLLIRIKDLPTKKEVAK